MLPAGSGPVQPQSPAVQFIMKCLTQSTSPVVLNWRENNSCALFSLGFSQAWPSNIVKWPRKQANIPLKSFLILQYVEYVRNTVSGLAFPLISTISWTFRKLFVSTSKWSYNFYWPCSCKWLTWKMTKVVHELFLHVVVVVAGVMFWMGVLMVFRMGVLMMNGLCSFLWLRFRRLRSPPGPDPGTGQPHVSCQNIGISAVIHLLLVCCVLCHGGPYSERWPNFLCTVCNPNVPAVQFKSIGHL